MNYKNNDLQDNIEPSVALQKHKKAAWYEKRLQSTRFVYIYQPTCFHVGCAWKSKGFLSAEHKWTEVALTQLSFKAISGDA